MSDFLVFTFLFAIGSMVGWGIEVIFRRFFSAHRWVNPGFLQGPCLPLYGASLCILYSLTFLEDDIPIDTVWLKKILLFVAMSIAITILEYIVGVVSIKVTKVRLWDYSNEWGNFKGIICPRFSFFWMILSAIYYFLINEHIQEALDWLSQNLAFSFGIGFFYGIFVLDLAYSIQLITKLKQFAEEKQIIITLSELKEDIHRQIEDEKQKIAEGKAELLLGKELFEQRKQNFLLALHSGKPLRESLEEYRKMYFEAEKIMSERRSKK